MTNKIRILVVDDHAIMRDGVRALLSLQDDIEIVGEAADGREALNRALELRPDVVLMDIAMPGLDGLEATRRIIRKLPSAKVLVLTQHDNREYVLTAIKAGASGYVPKRALGSELVTAVHAVHRGDSFLYPSVATVLIDGYRRGDNNLDAGFSGLTAREREILKLIAEGHTSREVGEILEISLKTVQGHRTRIMSKLDLHNRTELIKYAMRKDLVTLED
jgi:DNA-binding NarL/FixJ family response regulator